MYIAILFFVAGHVLAWYAFNSQFVWEWAREYVWAPALLCNFPMALAFLYGTRFAVEETGELWTARLVGFGASYMCFPLMTWYYINESMFTAKTMICVFLAFLILGIQFFWR